MFNVSINSFTMWLIREKIRLCSVIHWLDFWFHWPKIHSFVLHLDFFDSISTDSFCNTISKRLVQISSLIHFVTYLFDSISQRIIHICSLIHFVTWLILSHSKIISSHLFTDSFCDLTWLQLTKHFFRYFFQRIIL